MSFADTTYLDAVIADGAQDSGPLDISGRKYLCFLIPAGFEGTQLSFKTSDSLNGTYQQLDYDDGTKVLVTVAAGHACAVSKASIALAAINYLVIRAETVQTGAATIRVMAEAG